jgi:hypothetical protein
MRIYQWQLLAQMPKTNKNDYIRKCDEPCLTNCMPVTSTGKTVSRYIRADFCRTMMMAYDFASCEEIQCNLPHRPAPFFDDRQTIPLEPVSSYTRPILAVQQKPPHSWWTAVIRTSTMCDRAICCCKWGKGSKSGSERLRTHFDTASTLWHEKLDPKRTLSKLNENMLQGVD